MSKRERDVEERLTREMEARGLLCVKFIPDGRAGMPDRLVMLPGGKVLWVELKTQGGALSPLQRYQHIQLERHGQRVVTLWSYADVDALCAEMDARK